ncbi:hypothetical protein [Pseudoalteromonas sp. UBA6610]|uniref:hypothetical protein n=1 Tax=Pseudoalteromonas sp. UBA6610 TaxID=1947294 RepID=UPI002591603B|nr:hypothetical protein [Pseudoalteromonas sp. UBA6610]
MAKVVDKVFIALGILFAIIFLISIVEKYSSIQENEKGKFTGVSISSKWDAASVCKTARSVIKDRLPADKKKSIYHSKCEVIKVSTPLFGSYSHYEPYATKWSNNVAARVFITSSNKLKVMGISKSGVPSSWFKEEQ